MLFEKILGFHIHKIFIPRCKFISRCSKNFQSNINDLEGSRKNNSIIGPKMYAPTNYDKLVLVWMKKFKNKDEVPSLIRQELMYQTKNRARIKMANYLIFFALIGFCIAIYSGKQKAKQGDSIVKRVLHPD